MTSATSRTAVLVVAAIVVALIAFRPKRQAEVKPALSDAAQTSSTHSQVASRDPMLDSLVLTVHKSPLCGCCSKWVDHMKANGFNVVTVDHPDMIPVRQQLGVRTELQSCHTSKIGAYVIEGHVPAEDVLRLLREKPAVLGLAAPGMPNGSPGMEGLLKDKYNVLTFDKNGATIVFSER